MLEESPIVGYYVETLVGRGEAILNNVAEYCYTPPSVPSAKIHAAADAPEGALNDEEIDEI